MSALYLLSTVSGTLEVWSLYSIGFYLFLTQCCLIKLASSTMQTNQLPL